MLLEAAGINDIIITTGYLSDKLKEYVDLISGGLRLSYVYNADYNTTNYIKSLDLVEDILEDVLLLHGDLVFEPDVLAMLMASEKSCMVIDRMLPLPEKDFKAKMINDRISAIGIYYFGQDCVAAQPFYKLLSNDWRMWKDSIRDFCISGKSNVYAEEAFNVISDRFELVGLNADGKLCCEIDNKEDLIKIRTLLEKKEEWY